MRFDAQHNTQTHTQSKIAKIAKNTQKYTGFYALFWAFWAFLWRFYGPKLF
jgi:hypothetical protein